MVDINLLVFIILKKILHSQNLYESGVRMVAGCVAIDPTSSKILLVSSRKHPDEWILVRCFFSLSSSVIFVEFFFCIKTLAE